MALLDKERKGRVNHKEKYFADLGKMIRDNYLSILKTPDLLTPFGLLERQGRVLRFPAGGALSSAESKQENPVKIDLIARLLDQGERVNLRGHAQIEASRLDRLFGETPMDAEIEVTAEQLKDVLQYRDLIGTRDSSSSPFEYAGAYHCGGFQGMGPVGGVQGALIQTGETVNRLIEKLGEDFVKEKIQNGELTIGVELPGNLTIYLDVKSIGKNTYKIAPDKEKQEILGGLDNDNYWVICVDERVGGGELVEQDIGPGSVFPHATVVIGLADYNDPDSLAFAASLDNFRLKDPVSDEPEPTSAGLKFIMPGLANLTGKEAKIFAGGVATLWELLNTEMLAHSGTSGKNWEIGLKGLDQRLPLYRPGVWEQLKDIMSFHHGTIAVTVLKGKISPDIISALKKQKIPVIEVET